MSGMKPGRMEHPPRLGFAFGDVRHVAGLREIAFAQPSLSVFREFAASSEMRSSRSYLA